MPKAGQDAGYNVGRLSKEDRLRFGLDEPTSSQTIPGNELPSLERVADYHPGRTTQFEGSHARTEPTITSWEMQKLMGLGINLGNVLETPFEGKFSHTPTAKHFEMFHHAGFANCRIPVSWGKHMMAEEPYTVDRKFMDRVEELVNYSLAHGMVTVITAHHEWWIDFDDESHQKHTEWLFKALPRFQALWRQIGERFKHHRQLLVFGILNEPHALSDVSLNELHRTALVAIRESNPVRIVTISGKGFASPKWLLKNPKALSIPRDPQVMLEIHMTDPHGFAGTNPTQKAWGSAADRAKLQDWVQKIELYGRARNLPIYVGEFGCSNDWSHEHRGAVWLEANWKEMRQRGFAACLWDDGERFKIYDRQEGVWDQMVLAALQRSLPGLQGVSLYRHGGGLGGDSADPIVDLQRNLEDAFARLNVALTDVHKLPQLGEHDYKSHELGVDYSKRAAASEASDESSSDSD